MYLEVLRKYPQGTAYACIQRTFQLFTPQELLGEQRDSKEFHESCMRMLQRVSVCIPRAIHRVPESVTRKWKAAGGIPARDYHEVIATCKQRMFKDDMLCLLALSEFFGWSMFDVILKPKLSGLRLHKAALELLAFIPDVKLCIVSISLGLTKDCVYGGRMFASVPFLDGVLVWIKDRTDILAQHVGCDVSIRISSHMLCRFCCYVGGSNAAYPSANSMNPSLLV